MWRRAYGTVLLTATNCPMVSVLTRSPGSKVNVGVVGGGLQALRGMVEQPCVMWTCEGHVDRRGEGDVCAGRAWGSRYMGMVRRMERSQDVCAAHAGLW